MKRKFFLLPFIIVFYSLATIFVPTITPQAFAQIADCTGLIKDKDNNPLTDVEIKVYSVDDLSPGGTAPPVSKNNADGTYAFRTNLTNTPRMEFSKDTYQTFTVINQKCPGDITLKSESEPATPGTKIYVCNKGNCEEKTATGTETNSFSDEASCNNDCGKYTVATNCVNISTLPDTPDVFYSQSACMKNNIVQKTCGKEQLYRFNVVANTCVTAQQGDGGSTPVSLENCLEYKGTPPPAGTIPSPVPCPSIQVFTTPPPPCEDKFVINGICTRINTGAGIIPTDSTGFIKWFFGFILGIGGGIALLLIIYSGYKFMTSRGDPERTKGAKETFNSALIGLVFLIFSFVILQVISTTILNIPGIK